MPCTSRTTVLPIRSILVSTEIDELSCFEEYEIRSMDNNDTFEGRPINDYHIGGRIMYWKKYRLLLSDNLMLQVWTNNDQVAKQLICNECIIQSDYLCVQQDTSILIFRNDINDGCCFELEDSVSKVYGAFSVDGECILAVSSISELTAYKANFEERDLKELDLPKFIKRMNNYAVTGLGIIQKGPNAIYLYRWGDILAPEYHEESRIAIEKGSYVTCLFSNILVCRRESDEMLVAYDIKSRRQLWSSRMDSIVGMNSMCICSEKQVIDCMTGKIVYCMTDGWTIKGMTCKSDSSGYIVWQQAPEEIRSSWRDVFKNAICW